MQDWLSQELDYVFGDKPFEDWSYTKDFPRLKRPLAILYETLRLYCPVPMAKSTGNADRVLHVEDKTYVLPKNCLFIPNNVAVHTHPKFWGSDSMEWNPSRWIEQPSQRDSIDEERFKEIRKGTFIA